MYSDIDDGCLASRIQRFCIGWFNTRHKCGYRSVGHVQRPRCCTHTLLLSGNKWCFKMMEECRWYVRSANVCPMNWPLQHLMIQSVSNNSIARQQHTHTYAIGFERRYTRHRRMTYHRVSNKRNSIRWRSSYVNDGHCCYITLRDSAR